MYSQLEAARLGVGVPFSEDRIALAAAVSAQLIKSKRIAENPAAAYFAFWIRKAALERLSESFQSGLPSGCISGPRGLVFHLPPQNVETIFLYSWIIAYLTGNANLVRLPSVISSTIQEIIGQIIDELTRRGDNSQYFVHYPAENELNARLCALSDARIVWGGDAKVAAFAELPLRSGGKSIWFGDRFSFAVLRGTALVGLAPRSRVELANRLCNDVFIFDQMACSSPHIIYVIGKPEESSSAVSALLEEVAAAAQAKGIEVATSQALRKMVTANKMVGLGEAKSVATLSNALMAIQVDDSRRTETRVGGGFLQVCYIDQLDALRKQAREHDQTMTYFGFERAELEALFPLCTPLGLTRVVPVGEALNFDTVWDGYDLPRELTRVIRIA